jgi:hypothetical protein
MGAATSCGVRCVASYCFLSTKKNGIKDLQLPGVGDLALEESQKNGYHQNE